MQFNSIEEAENWNFYPKPELNKEEDPRVCSAVTSWL